MEKAYIKYDAAGRLTPGVLRNGDHPPSGPGWVEVPATICCSTTVLAPTVTGTRFLKGFIRYAKNGRVIQGSTVVRKKNPTDGKWVQIPYNRCC